MVGFRLLNEAIVERYRRGTRPGGGVEVKNLTQQQRQAIKRRLQEIHLQAELQTSAIDHSHTQALIQAAQESIRSRLRANSRQARRDDRLRRVVSEILTRGILTNKPPPPPLQSRTLPPSPQ